MENITRRGFVELGIGGASVLAGAAACGSRTPEASAAETSDTPEELAKLGGSSMSLEELNRRRRELIDSKGDYTCPDGTVVPALWNKLRTLVNCYGIGCGEPTGGAEEFAFFQNSFSEEEAQAYLEMPMGVMFTASDFVLSSGRSEKECQDICNELASRGMLYKTVRAGIPYYHQLNLMHGMGEYNLNRYWDAEYWPKPFSDILDLTDDQGGPFGTQLGTCFYFPIPCSEEVVTDQTISPFEDWRAIVARHSVIAVSPCQCRMGACIEEGSMPPLHDPRLRDYVSPINGHPIETCLTFGEEAQYYIDRGIGRKIDQAEATAILERSIENGLVIQSAFTRENAVICQCHGDSCVILSTLAALGPDYCAASPTMPNYSHYVLDYDKDACIQCGACVERCPMYAISMNDEGYPEVNACCVRCGQCGMVCPVGARTLSAKSPDEYIEIPATMMDDYNLKAAYRFDHDMIR